MGAVLVTQGELGKGLDTSVAAFWLPFQDSTSHNQIAQWTQKVVANSDAGCVILEGSGCAPSGSGSDGGGVFH